MKCALRIAAFVAALLATPAYALISTPVGLGSNNAAAGSANLVITTGSACGANALIITFPGQNSSSGTVNSVTASSGDSLSSTVAISNAGNNKFRLYYKQGALALGSGGTLTIVYSTSTVAQVASSVCVTGTKTALSLDAQAGGTSGNNTHFASTLSTGPLAQSYELLIGVTLISAGASDTWTEDAAWTSLPTSSESGSGLVIHAAYKIVTSTTSVVYAPSWSATRQYSANVYSFEGIGTGKSGFGPTMGIVQ